MKNVAIIMAAGKGVRAASEVPKQFVQVGDKMLIEYSLQLFQLHPLIDEIVVVLPPDYVEMEEMVTYLFQYYSKVTQVLAGGDERFQSSWAAIQWFADRRDDNLLLHDAARPGVTLRIVDDLLEALSHSQAVVTALPATDTILRVNAQGRVLETLKREELYSAQTPQAFRAGLLYDCFIDFCNTEESFMPTDESGVVAQDRPQAPISLVPGDPRKFQVTYLEDFEIWARRVSMER